MLSHSATRSSPMPAALAAEIVALRRYHGDADPGVLVRLAHQRLSFSVGVLESKAFGDELAVLRADLDLLRLALRLERLRAEYKANFDPNQPRDEDGKWTDGGREAPDGDSSIEDSEYGSVFELASDITGFTKHGINQAINRGVSPFDILDALRNPLEIVPQSGGRTRYEGGGAVVVLNSTGKVITVWRRGR